MEQRGVPAQYSGQALVTTATVKRGIMVLALGPIVMFMLRWGHPEFELPT